MTDLTTADRVRPEVEAQVLAILSKTPSYAEVDAALAGGAFDEAVAMLSSSKDAYWHGRLWTRPEPRMDGPLYGPMLEITGDPRWAVESASRVATQLTGEARHAARLVISDSVRARRSRSDTVNLLRYLAGLTYLQTQQVLTQVRVEHPMRWAALALAAARHRTRRAAAIARTETVRAANRAYRLERPQRRLRWVTEQDERTCWYCGPLDGTTVDWGVEEPPVHPGCRCTLEEL